MGFKTQFLLRKEQENNTLGGVKMAEVELFGIENKIVGCVIDRKSLFAEGITDDNLICRKCYKILQDFGIIDIKVDDLDSQWISNPTCARCGREWDKKKLKWYKTKK